AAQPRTHRARVLYVQQVPRLLLGDESRPVYAEPLQRARRSLALGRGPNACFQWVVLLRASVPQRGPRLPRQDPGRLDCGGGFEEQGGGPTNKNPGGESYLVNRVGRGPPRLDRRSTAGTRR